MAPAVLYIFQLMGPSNELLVHEPFRSSDCRRLNPSPRILSSKVASVLRLSTACVEVSPRRRSILSSKILSLSYKSSYETILSSQPCVGHCINKVRPFYKVFYLRLSTSTGRWRTCALHKLLWPSLGPVFHMPLSVAINPVLGYSNLSEALVLLQNWY